MRVIGVGLETGGGVYCFGFRTISTRNGLEIQAANWL